MKKITGIAVGLLLVASVLGGCGEKPKVEQDTEKVENVINADLEEKENKTEPEENNEEAFDEELTASVKAWMEERCGGEWGADWYPDIIDIKMFSTGGKQWAVIESKAEGDVTNQTIGETVMQYEQWIDTAFVHDEQGNELYFGENPYNKDAYK